MVMYNYYKEKSMELKPSFKQYFYSQFKTYSFIIRNDDNDIIFKEINGSLHRKVVSVISAILFISIYAYIFFQLLKELDYIYVIVCGVVYSIISGLVANALYPIILFRIAKFEIVDREDIISNYPRIKL